MSRAKMRVLVVANESPWPPSHGGRVRMARLTEHLAEYAEISVCFHRKEGDAEPPPATGIRVFALPASPVPRHQQITRPREPFLGRRALGGIIDGLADAAASTSPDVIYWTHSYLRAVLPNPFAQMAVHHVVEFANIERGRFRSLASSGAWINRSSAALEAAKASYWEPLVARNAHLAVALDPTELEQLRLDGARTLYLPNGFEERFTGPSPSTPTILAVGNWEYRPNVESLRGFIESEWPLIVVPLPAARLVVIGRGSEAFTDLSRNIFGKGFVDDLSPEYREAMLVLAPASAGGGSQLKVSEALSHGRIVVGPPYLARERRDGLPSGAIVAADSDHIVEAICRLVRDERYRHDVEREIITYCRSHTWEGVASRLASVLSSLGPTAKRVPAAIGTDVDGPEAARLVGMPSERDLGDPECFVHLILTRFNVRTKADAPAPSDEWMERRIELFEKYLVSSMLVQDCQRFRWFVFCDGETKAEFRERLDDVSSRFGQIFETVYVEGIFSAEVIRELVVEPLLRRMRTRYLITTRVDNDDAVATDFVLEIQRNFRAEGLSFLNLVSGAQLASGRVYRRPYTSNPFISLVEEVLPNQSPRTVFVGQHDHLAAHGPIENIRTNHPIWLQVVHGQNLANEVVGVRMPVRQLAAWFPQLELKDDPESRFRVLADQFSTGAKVVLRLCAKPSRWVELARAVLARR